MFLLLMQCIKTAQFKEKTIHVVLPNNDYGINVDKAMQWKMNTWLLHNACFDICCFLNMRDSQIQNEWNITEAITRKISYYHDHRNIIFQGYLLRRLQSTNCKLLSDIRDFMDFKFVHFLKSSTYGKLIARLKCSSTNISEEKWSQMILCGYCLTLANFFSINYSRLRIEHLVLLRDIFLHVKYGIFFFNEAFKDPEHPFTQNNIATSTLFYNCAFEKFVSVQKCMLVTNGIERELIKIHKLPQFDRQVSQIHIIVIDIFLEIFKIHYKALQETNSKAVKFTKQSEYLQILYNAFSVEYDNLIRILQKQTCERAKVVMITNYSISHLSALYYIFNEGSEIYKQCSYFDILVLKIVDTWTRILPVCLLGVTRTISLEDFRTCQTAASDSIFPLAQEKIVYYKLVPISLKSKFEEQNLVFDFTCSKLLLPLQIPIYMYADTKLKRLAEITAAKLTILDCDTYTCFALYIIPVIQQICQLRRIFSIKGFQILYNTQTLDNFMALPMVDNVLMAWECINFISQMSICERKFFYEVCLLLPSKYCNTDEKKKALHIIIINRYIKFDKKTSIAQNDITAPKIFDMISIVNNEMTQDVHDRAIRIQKHNDCDQTSLPFDTNDDELSKLVDKITQNDDEDVMLSKLVDEILQNDNEDDELPKPIDEKTQIGKNEDGILLNDPRQTVTNIFNKYRCRCLIPLCRSCRIRPELMALIEGWITPLVEAENGQKGRTGEQVNVLELNFDSRVERIAKIFSCNCVGEKIFECSIKSKLLELIDAYTREKFANESDNASLHNTVDNEKTDECAYLNSNINNAILSFIKANEQKLADSYVRKLSNGYTENADPLYRYSRNHHLIHDQIMMTNAMNPLYGIARKSWLNPDAVPFIVRQRQNTHRTFSGWR